MPAFDSPPADSFRRDAKVIGLVGFAHSLSHFLQLALAPLFPLLKAEFGVSYATLGTLVGVFYGASGISQFCAGFAVDRFGARRVLLSGLSLVAGGAMLAGLAPAFGWLFPIVALMGIGNGVFHPADFAILNANVSPGRLGHAYSMHGVGGNLGYALAPMASFALGAAFGWHVALIVLGLAGLGGLAVLSRERASLSCHHGGKGTWHSVAGSLALFRQLPIVLCFAYFCVYTIATVGLQSFLPTALNAAFDIPLAIATSGLTAWLLGSTAGIVAGGVFATRTDRHDRVAGAGLVSGSLLMILLAVWAPSDSAVLPLLALAGFALGSTGPSRDMIVRGAAPKGATGRVYGFVYSGLDLGAMLGPIWFGYLLDHGAARGIFFAAAGCFVVAIATVVQVRRASAVRGVSA